MLEFRAYTCGDDESMTGAFHVEFSAESLAGDSLILASDVPSGIARRSKPSAKTHVLWFLSGQTDEGEVVRHVPLHTFPFRVGRRSDVSLNLTNRTVSGLHAEIVERGERLQLRDLGSRNGTFVNGQGVDGTVLLEENDLVQFGDVPFRVRLRPCETEGLTLTTRGCDYAIALIQFDELMSSRAVTPYFQPIIDFRNGNAVGYEMLGRSRVYGMEMPKQMFQAASQLEREVELSRMFRSEAVRATSPLNHPPHLFVNMHPKELCDPDFIVGLRELRELNPGQPLTLEIHESAVTDLKTMIYLRSALSDLDIRLAYDDFGAGRDRLIPLIEVRPDYLKFDMGLVRDIDRAPAPRQKMLETLVKMVSDLRHHLAR